MRSDHDLRYVILRLGHIELRAIFVVEVIDILVRNRNFGDHFAIQQLLHGKLATDIVFQIVYRQPGVVQFLLKLFFGVRALSFREFIFHFGVGGD